jgi:hypothetical protein
MTKRALIDFKPEAQIDSITPTAPELILHTPSATRHNCAYLEFNWKSKAGMRSWKNAARKVERY